MIVARKIRGFYGKIRNYVRFALLVFYLIIPWLKWGDRPMVLLDIANRKFFFPGAVFWPQEFYFLLIILLIAGTALFFFTSLLGRLWCGWACPQTIFTEVFDSIGRFVSPRFGKASQKTWEKGLVYFVWLLAATFLTFHFMAYFTGAQLMINDTLEHGSQVFSNVTWPWFLLALTGMFYFDLAYFRHNFCVYLCPYARFQSVMLDEESVVIAYDKHRGEPRRVKKIKPGSPEEANVGDCTGCRKCVQVCPTGIDIREGLQVACINCTHCVDACDEEMAAYDKPSLVDFASTSYFESRKPARLLRPRIIVYAVLFVTSIVIFVTMLSTRTPMYASVFRDRSIQPFIINNVVQNIYEFSVGNESEEAVHLELKVILEKDNEFISEIRILGKQKISMTPNELKKIRIVLQSDLIKDNPVKRTIPTLFKIVNPITGKSLEKKTIFTIPKGKIKQ